MSPAPFDFPHAPTPTIPAGDGRGESLISNPIAPAGLNPRVVVFGAESIWDERVPVRPIDGVEAAVLLQKLEACPPRPSP